MARILYIEDQPMAQKLLESVLTKAGHKVTLAGDGYAGIAEMQRQSFDLIITDVIMPGGVSGIDVTRTIRKQVGPDKLPIILLTGRRERRDVERAIEVGVSDYVVKPVDPPVILAKIDLALKVVADLNAAAGNVVAVTMTEALTTHPGAWVTGLTEKGLTLRSSHPFEVGAKVDLGANFFVRRGLNIALDLVVKTSLALPPGQFRVQLEYVDLSEDTLKALRLWISFNHARKAV